MTDYDPNEIEKWITDHVAKSVKADVEKKTDKAVKNVQKDMLSKITAASPVRYYSTHSQTVSEISVHRSPNASHAVKRVKTEKYQPGYFKSGWVKGTLKTKYGKIYGVRNKHMPTVSHLLNFDHSHISHGEYKGTVKGSEFIDKVSEEAQAQLDNELSSFLERK